MSDPVQLSVRQPNTDSGGPVVPAWESNGHVDGRNNLLILIHGYNDSRLDALGFYKEFLDNLKDKFSTGLDQVVEFHWPGDKPNKVISTLGYAEEIRPAIDSARELASFLGGLRPPGPISVNLVAHSLGCRLALELLALWTGGLPPNISIRAVVLMAAAVVIRHVEDGGPLKAAAIMAARNPVLFSKGDSVLHWAFPTGETMGGEGFFPTAVGRTGGPPGDWHVPKAMAHNGDLYGHGSYWPGVESATEVAFALGGAPASSTPENAVVSGPPPVENAIAARTTPVRMLDSRPAFA